MSLIDAIFVVSPLKWIQQKGNREKFTDLQHICCWVIVLFTQTFHYLKSGGIAKSWLFINWSWVALKLILKSQVSVFKSSGIIRHWTFFAAIVRKLLKLIQTQFETTALALINNWETWCQNNTYLLCAAVTWRGSQGCSYGLHIVWAGPENPQDFFAPAPVNNSRGASLLRSHERLQW